MVLGPRLEFTAKTQVKMAGTNVYEADTPKEGTGGRCASLPKLTGGFN